MAAPKKEKKSVQSAAGELRQDLVTSKWVTIATGRAKRPHSFSVKNGKEKPLPKYKEDCPFCNLAAYPQEPDVVRLPDSADDWRVHIFGNKYPAFDAKEEFRTWNTGPYRAMEAVGYHDVLATRDHNEIDAALSVTDLSLQLEALQLRYQDLMTKQSVNYIQIMKNSGPEAGASLEHPHHQIFTTPVLPSDIDDMLTGAERYASEHSTSPFTALVDFELEAAERAVWENDTFVVFWPYASRAPFLMWVAPKQHQSYWHEITAQERTSLAEALSQALRRLSKGLNNPSYNYFINSAPCDDTGFVCNIESFQHFRWHIEVMPRFGALGGFEMITGLEIVTALPEESAAFLRDVKV